MGSMDVRVVRQTDKPDRVIVLCNHPSLSAYSAFHCGPNGCEHFEEIPAKEEALTPGASPGSPPRWGCLSKIRSAALKPRDPDAPRRRILRIRCVRLV